MSLEAPAAETAPKRRRKPRRTSEQENFIPLRKADLRAAILADPLLNSQQREQLAQLCLLLEAALHHEYHDLLERLKDAYAPFDPDADTRGSAALGQDGRDEPADDFFDRLMDLLDRANYQHLLHEHLTDALDEASAFGIHLDVDFSVFKRLEIFARSSGTVTKRLPFAWHRWRGKTIDIPVYRRLVLLFQLRENRRVAGPLVDTNTICVKIFKDIPKSDLDMLLPGTRVRMSWFDQGKVAFPSVTGVALALYKIIAGAATLLFTGVYGLLALLGLVGGTIGYGIRSFFSYLNMKDKYHLTLTRSLYFQNLDNNAGVIFRLLDEAEEQEFREAILAYFLLWKHAGREGWTIEELDAAAEQFLQEKTGIVVDFEIGDALDKLVAMKLVSPVAGARWRAAELDEALAILDATWDGIFQARQGHQQQTQRKQSLHFAHASPPAPPPLDSNDWGPVL